MESNDKATHSANGGNSLADSAACSYSVLYPRAEVKYLCHYTLTHTREEVADCVCAGRGCQSADGPSGE
eukprot:5140403-Pleurochrysis_carterae.AAC.1